MKDVYSPRPHQKCAEDWLMTHPRAGLFYDMGTGKTAATLTAIYRLLYEEFAINRILIIAPINVAKDTWPVEIEKWAHLEGLTYSLLVGTAAQRLKALNTPADIHIINRDNVVWLCEQFKGPLPYDMVVLDELSSFKDAGTKRWRALRRKLAATKHVVGLTGTPAPNSYMDLYAEVYLLDNGERLGRTLGEFRTKYFDPGRRKGHVVYEWKIKRGAKERIDNLLSDICISAKDDSREPPLFIDQFVRMDSKEQSLYDRMVKDTILPLLPDGSITEAGDEDTATMVDGKTSAVLQNKLLQMASGAVYDDAGNVLRVHERKLDALDDLIEAAVGKPVLVFYAYKHEAEAIMKRHPEALLLTDHKKDISGLIKKWNDREIPILLAHPASAGHGLNLQYGSNIMVWYSLPWSLELYEQANARLARPGQTERVRIYHLLTRGTVDEKVPQVLQGKCDTQTALLNALKARVDKANDKGGKVA